MAENLIFVDTKKNSCFACALVFLFILHYVKNDLPAILKVQYKYLNSVVCRLPLVVLGRTTACVQFSFTVFNF